MMAKYNPDKHHRHSIRLKGYDYSQQGAYFVTICTQNREHLFGSVKNGEMNLNEAGQMIVRWWHELVNKFPTVESADFVVMPNHFHGIINIVGPESGRADLGVGTESGGADLGISPTDLGIGPESGGADLGVSPAPIGQTHTGQTHTGQTHTGQTHRSAPTLGEIMQWFKTMTTNEYIRGVKQHGWIPFPGKLWQRNYYEHIIRNEQVYHAVCQYIIQNPQRWSLDHHNPSVTEQDPEAVKLWHMFQSTP